ncbi:potassium transporter TrkA, partial [Pseudomonas sp. HMWF031]
MRDWWNWSQSTESDPQSFGIVGVGRFGSAVCRQLMQNGAEV